MGEEKNADIKKYLMLDLRIIVGTIIHSQIVRTIPEKAVKMTLEITDDPRSSSTCGGLEMVKEDRAGGRAEREIELGEERDAGEVVESQENTMNTRVKANQVTKFLSKSTSNVFVYNFLFYRRRRGFKAKRRVGLMSTYGRWRKFLCFSYGFCNDH